MASRVARSIFTNAVRTTVRPTRAAHQFGRRHMSASESSHGSSHGSSSSSNDRPWIIGSALFFGPIFLYLLSPSSRKKHAEHAVHDDKHDYGLHAAKHEVEAPLPQAEVTMKDDDGTEANVTESLAAAEHEDIPKVGEAVKDPALPTVSSTPGIEKVEAEDKSTSSEAEAADPERDELRARQLEKGTTGNVEEGFAARPTNMGDARRDAREQKTPKVQAEEKKEEAQEDAKV